MLFRAAISCSYRGDGQGLGQQLFPSAERERWRDPGRPAQRGLFQPRMVLDQKFYEELL